MQIIVQPDTDIPVHIVSTVNANTAKLEEQLVREHRHEIKHSKRNNTKPIDVGLTVSNDHDSIGSSKARLRKQSTTLKRDNDDTDIMEVDETEQTAEILSQYNKSQHEGLASSSAKQSKKKTTVKGNAADKNGGVVDDIDEGADKENKDVRGSNIYKFRANLRKSVNTMIKKATSSVQEVDTDEQNASTRRSTRVKKASKKAASTSEKRPVNYSKRQQFLRQIERMRNDRNNSDDEEEDVDALSEDEDEPESQHRDDMEMDDEEEDEDADTNKPSTLENEGYERYFQDLHYSTKTSNNTLSRLPILEPQQFKNLLDKAPAKHKEEIKTLFNMHKQFFPQWYFELHSGFNLLFYGYGSKRNLLNEFAQSCLTEGPLVVVNGFFPSVSIKDILLKITAGALELTGPTGSLQDHIQFICNYFASNDREYECLYLVIHNLDGPNLRNERTQTALSMLASATNIHVVASVDHINAGLLWDNVKSTRFNWIWHDATTFDNYLVETSFENSLLVRSSEVGGARGAKYVLDSLTTNARGVFKILAEHQLQEMAESNMEGRGNESVGLTYGQYYQKCRDQFFVSSDLALRTELTEFKDHKLISIKKTLDGTEIFYIPLDQDTLTGLLEQLN